MTDLKAHSALDAGWATDGLGLSILFDVATSSAVRDRNLTGEKCGILEANFR
jgi:hypothetical protein